MSNALQPVSQSGDGFNHLGLLLPCPAGRRENAGSDLLGEPGHRLPDRFTGLRILFDERWNRRSSEREHVVRDQHLAVAIGSGTNADNGDVQGGREMARGFVGNAFDHNRERARGLESTAIFEELLLLFACAPLTPEPANGVNGLRLQANVSHDGNARCNNAGNRGCDRLTTFDFDRCSTAILQQPPGVAQ
ncbi:MAG TPA: hypothetical protein VHY79_00955, partial [Rhizomicrobium sp.]|nr:hypothetical protein [Rhizomicrobium sp.]